jgi:HAD superfamily hydrolase (TIGR01509 family)
MIEAVIFDMDGVLVDSEPLHLEATNTILGQFGLHYTEEEIKPYLGMDERSFWAEMREKHGLEADPEGLGKERIAEAVRMIREGLQPMPGVPEVITGLHMRGLTLAVATSSARIVAEATLDEIGLMNSFRAVITADDVARAKPDPAIFLKAAEAIDCLPETCMVIEDSPNGIDAAVRARMFTVAVLNRYNQSLDLSAAARIFSGLERLDWKIFDER